MAASRPDDVQRHDGIGQWRTIPIPAVRACGNGAGQRLTRRAAQRGKRPPRALVVQQHIQGVERDARLDKEKLRAISRRHENAGELRLQRRGERSRIDDVVHRSANIVRHRGVREAPSTSDSSDRPAVIGFGGENRRAYFVRVRGPVRSHRLDTKATDAVRSHEPGWRTVTVDRKVVDAPIAPRIIAIKCWFCCGNQLLALRLYLARRRRLVYRNCWHGSALRVCAGRLRSSMAKMNATAAAGNTITALVAIGNSGPGAARARRALGPSVAACQETST